MSQPFDRHIRDTAERLDDLDVCRTPESQLDGNLRPATTSLEVCCAFMALKIAT